MPEPVRRGQRYMPGLDGLRALAVLAVIAYHLNLGWAQGGLLGVGVFFTLSGYLITDLLLGQQAMGGLHLGDFWLRRARRLLPGLFVMLAVVAVWVALAEPDQLGALRGAVVSASLYVNNWWLISQHVSYFARFGPPSPLGHLWSLAVEEQFYLLWPWLLWLGLRCVRERDGRVWVRLRLATVTLALAGASAVAMVVLHHPWFDSTRVYDGTDTRAFGLLFGAALAMVWPSRLLSIRVPNRSRRVLDIVGSAGLAGIALLVWRTNEYSAFLYRGGLVLLSLATVCVVAALAHPATRLGRRLGWAPLRWLGVRSYGIYLWHMPIIVLTTPATATRVDPLRAALQVAATIGVAALSWRFVEEPIRHGALARGWVRARSARWRPRALPGRSWAAVTATLAVLTLAGVGLAGVSPPGSVSSLAAAIRVETTYTSPPPTRTTETAATTASLTAVPAGPPRAARAPAAGATAPSTHTSCRALVHIGDSTSEGLVSPAYLPNRSQRIDVQYARVGATSQHLEIAGAVSIVETLPGQTNARDVARRLVRNRYRGCWVLALGTNDTADVYVGSSVNVTARIKRMMAVIGHQPVMWVNVKSLRASGPYAERNMKRWNQALRRACPRYPNMRVYDWAAVVRNRWFIPDGIHYTSPGYAARSRLIAHALARAFPRARGAHPAGCIVH
jgi:peptidoglycan/LPS O-acetylase OafA/YrhL